MRAFPVVAAALAFTQAPAAQPAVNVVNPLSVARPAETIVLDAAAVLELVPVKDVREVRVRDGKSGTDVLTQAIDLDDNGRFDQLVFQADLAPSETRTFTLAAGERRIAQKEEFRAYGRFVRERRDDFAWENDLVAHRMYGTALETWAQEPLTSSAIDVWVKKTRRLVINDWYMVDDYHRDTGDGADFYSAGKTRGCGGSGVWRNGALHVSRNFTHSRVIANGPIRIMFELTYDAWDTGGTPTREIKRITLDAGQHLNRIESTYDGLPADARIGIGIRVNPGSQVNASEPDGTLRTWEPIKNDAAANGWMGCAIVAPGPEAGLRTSPPVDGNYLVVVPAVNQRVTYYAGSAWNRGGTIQDVAGWDAYVRRAAARLRAPVQVTLGRSSVRDR